MAEWLDLRDGGRLLYEPSFCAPGKADALLAWLLSTIPWRQEWVHGQPLPRLNAWFADEGLRWRYAGLSHPGAGWLPVLAALKRAVGNLAGVDFNSLLLNRYRHGQDHIGLHTDALPELGENPVIATVSFGAERDFVLEHGKTGERRTYRLGHGSLLVLGGTAQHHWLHGLPPTAKPVGERISLTFRLLRDSS